MAINTWGETLNSWDNSGVVTDTTAPVITVSGNAITEIQGNTPTPVFTATAFDNADGDITANIIVGGDTVNTAVLGSYVITYNVQDSSSNSATQVTRTINVVDTLSPSISVTGTPTTIVDINGVAPIFTATATDSFYGDITGSIVESGDTINVNTLGTYTRRWNVTDASGNVAPEVTRRVIVRDPLAGVPLEFRKNILSLNSYLVTQGFDKTLPDNLNNWLDAEGFFGNFNDKFYYYLDSLGYKGSLRDKIKAWSVS